MAQLFFATALLSACASPIPNFRPSLAVEKASTLEEAIKICDEYQIKDYVENQPVAAAQSIPWTRCIENTIRYVPKARESEPLAMLFHELSRIENAAGPTLELKSVFPKQMNAAMRASFRYLMSDARRDSTPQKVLTSEDRAMIAVALPGFDTYLRAL